MKAKDIYMFAITIIAVLGLLTSVIALNGLNEIEVTHGIDGEDGTDGDDGADGINGINGINGSDGKDCVLNQPPVIEYTTVVERLFSDEVPNKKLHVRIRDSDSKLLKCQMYWRICSSQPWTMFSDETKGETSENMFYFGSVRIPLYGDCTPEQKLIFMYWRIDVTDGYNLVTQTQRISYWHPIICS